MTLFKWDESYSVGNDRIDWQHKKLIDMINEFYQNLQDRLPKEGISVLIKRLNDYIEVHFKTEEDILRKIGYPRLDAHIIEHEKFIKKVHDIEKRHNEGTLLLTVELTSFLKDWLKDHILRKDKHYKDYII